MHGADWTPELDAEIVRLRRDERLSTPQIASRVGRTTGAVYARFRNIDALIMDRREWAADEVESLVALVEAGELTIRAVAEELGRTETSVRWKLEHLGAYSDEAGH
jgi:AcrR family transcriptional regulator